MQVKSVTPPCAIVSVMLVSVRLGFTPVHWAPGQPAAEPLTVVGADRAAGLVVKVRFPFLTSLPGIVVGVVVGVVVKRRDHHTTRD